MANIMRRDPFLDSMRHAGSLSDLDDLFRGFWLRPLPLREMEASPQIRIDLKESDTAYTVRAEIPGVKKEDIKVDISGNQVSISAAVRQAKEEKQGEKVICRECYQGASFRSLALDSDVDEAKAEARYENGILELKLPKKIGKSTKQIQVH